MTLTLALNSAISGLLTAQKGLDTVSHNVANVNTQGYSRKIFTPESRILGGVGAGVQVAEVSRRVDEGLREDLREATSLNSRYAASQVIYDRIQDLFGQPGDNTTISHAISALGAELETLSVESHLASQKDEVISTATTLAEKFNQMSEDLQTLRAEIDNEISLNVTTINGYLSNIQTLNEKITLAKATGKGAADLEDKRDEVLLQLSKMMDVKYFIGSTGTATVYTASGVTLVENEAKRLTHSANSSPLPWDSADNGGIDGIWVGTEDLTDDIRSGQLRGLIDMRDKELVNLQAQIDELAGALKETLNSAHNKGTSFPTLMNNVKASRSFIDTMTQTMKINDLNADSVITIFDADGEQAATTTLRALFQSANGGTATDTATIQDFADELQSWLRTSAGLPNAEVNFGAPITTTATANAAVGTNTLTLADVSNLKAGMRYQLGGVDYKIASVNSTTNQITLDQNLATAVNTGDAVTGQPTSGKMAINLNDSTYGIGFRDQVSSSGGADMSDLPISFDMNGDGTIDQEHAGLSAFFGLNDVYASEKSQWQWDSPVHDSGFTMTGGLTLKFSTGTDGVDIGGVVVQAGDSLEDIANRINNSTALRDKVTATIVTEGRGQRLRIVSEDGSELAVCRTAGLKAAYDNLGLEPSSAGASRSIAVTTALSENPSRLSGGTMEYNNTTGEYYVSKGGNANAINLLEAFNSNREYNTAGGLSTAQLRLADYGANIVSSAAGRAASNEDVLEYQSGLTEALALKDAETSAVNLDEELSQLMVFEQSYAAAAKIISATQQMFDILNDIIR